jgi:hypothetical protein
LGEFRSTVYDLLRSGYSVDDMKQMLDDATTTFIIEAQGVVDQQINDIYGLSGDKAEAELKRLGLSSMEGVPDRSRINMLITQQKDNIEVMAMDIYGKIKKQINLSAVAGFYGSQSQ